MKCKIYEYITGHSTKTVSAYLPATRPYYNVNLSDNAKRIKNWRAKKNMGDIEKDC